MTLEAFGLKWGVIVAGFLGSCVSVRFVPGNWWQRLFTVGAGTLAAGYVTPVVSEFLKLSDRLEHGVGFLIGLFGLSIASSLLANMPAWLDAARKKLGG